MNKEKQRIKIAEAFGYHSIIVSDNGVLHGRRADMNYGTCGIPDYPNDLNAMHEAEKALTDKQWDDYAHQLAAVTGWDQFTNRIAVYHATAAQRAEAFLKTLGLLEDGE